MGSKSTAPQSPPRPPRKAKPDLDSIDQIHISLFLEEYRTLRTESLQGIQTRHQVITIAFGGISVVIAGILASDAPMIILGLIAFIGVPSIAKYSLLLWLGEYGRSARAGVRIRELEEEINLKAKGKILYWETGLSEARTHMTSPYTATVFVVLAISYLGSVIGIGYMSLFTYSKHDLIFSYFGLQAPIGQSVLSLLVGLVTATIAFVIECWFWRRFISAWRRTRFSQYETHPSPDLT